MASKEPRSVIDPSKYLNKKVRVKFSGGREVEGVLKGHDGVCNLVLDDTKEFLRAPEDNTPDEEKSRFLGLIVARGSAIVVIAPAEGFESIENPFVQAEA